MADPLISLRDIFDIAERKRGVDGWRAYAWKLANGGHLVEGAVPIGTFQRGPRAGRPKFPPGKGDVVVVSDSEMRDCVEAFERDTKLCWDCKGTGQVWVGWSRDAGDRHAPCTRCGGSVHVHG